MKTFTIVAVDMNGNEFCEEYVSVTARDAFVQFNKRKIVQSEVCF